MNENLSTVYLSDKVGFHAKMKHLNIFFFFFS